MAENEVSYASLQSLNTLTGVRDVAHGMREAAITFLIGRIVTFECSAGTIKLLVMGLAKAGIRNQLRDRTRRAFGGLVHAVELMFLATPVCWGGRMQQSRALRHRKWQKSQFFLLRQMCTKWLFSSTDGSSQRLHDMAGKGPHV